MACRIRICPFICLLIIISVLVGFIFAVFSLVISSAVAKFHVVNASLTQFNLTTSPTINNRNILSYNLTVEVQLRNPSKRIGIRYRRIRAAATYKGRRLGLITFPPFYQGNKNTTILHPLLFQGEALVKLKKSALKGFNKDQRLGRFDITIEFYLDLTFNFGGSKFRDDPKMLCDLKLPLASFNVSTSAVGGFKTKKCHEDNNYIIVVY